MPVQFCPVHKGQMSTLLSPKCWEALDNNMSLGDGVVKVSELVEGDKTWGQSYLAFENEMEPFYDGESYKLSEENEEMYDEFVGKLKPFCFECVKNLVNEVLREVEIDV